MVCWARRIYMRSRSEKIGLLLAALGIANVALAVAIHSLRTREKAPNEAPASVVSAREFDAGDDAEPPPTLVNADDADSGDDAGMPETAADADAPDAKNNDGEVVESETKSAPLPPSRPLETPQTPAPTPRASSNACLEGMSVYSLSCNACNIPACITLTNLCAASNETTMTKLFALRACNLCGGKYLPAYAAHCARFGLF